MHYVKQFNINGVDTKQVACIELQGKPNAATVGAVGLLGIDVTSPLHEVYKCVAVNGSIYTWELLSSGLSILAATIPGGGGEVVQFPYDNLKIPSGYVLKNGDLIVDSEGRLYQVSAIDVSSCSATYCNMAFAQGVQGEPGLTPYVGENGNWWIGDVDTGVSTLSECLIEGGSFVGTGTYGWQNPSSLTFTFPPKIVILSKYDGFCIFVRDVEKAMPLFSNSVSPYVFGKTLTVSWDDCTVSWYNNDSAAYQFNYECSYLGIG